MDQQFELIRLARESYDYPAARLRIAQVSEAPAIEYGTLRISIDIPISRNWWNLQDASPYTTRQLDAFHQDLLTSSEADCMLLGLLSVVFWGHIYGKDKVLRKGFALARAKRLAFGRKGACVQDTGEVLQALRKARLFLARGQVGDALKHALAIKFLGVSFASKVLAFMNPKTAVVFDSVIRGKLRQQRACVGWELPRLPRLEATDSNKEQQAMNYEHWCAWCCDIAARLNSNGVMWADYDQRRQTWRAVDVERAIFSC